MKLQYLLGALLLAVSSMSVNAQSVTNAFTDGQQQWSDDSGEILIDNDGDGMLSVGDWLVGGLGITSFPTTGTDPSSVNELTAVFAVEVLTAADVPNIACQTLIDSCAVFTFGATGDFNAAILAAYTLLGDAASAPTYTNVDANTVAIWLEDDTPDFDRDGGTVLDAFNSFTDGTERLTVGLIDANGDSWSGTGPQDLAEFGDVASGTGVGAFSVDGTITYQNFAGLVFDPNITASGNIKPTSTSDFVITDDATFEVFINQVPEPSAIALLGFGLLGLSFVSRRRSSTMM